MREVKSLAPNLLRLFNTGETRRNAADEEEGMITEEIVLTLRSVKCRLKEGERATADGWHDAHRSGNKQTGIALECFLTCLLHNVYALLRITMIHTHTYT